MSSLLNVEEKHVSTRIKTKNSAAELILMRLRNVVHTRWFILLDTKAVGAVRRYGMTRRVRRGMEQTESQSPVTCMKPVAHQPSI